MAKKVKEFRITFRSEVYIKATDIDELRQKWEELGLFSADALEDAFASVLEVVSVENADTYKDFTNEFNQ